MRKLIILGLMAAAAAVPTSAVAQDVSGDAEITREQRREARQERREQRQEARQQPPVVEVQAMQRPDRQERREQRQERREQRQDGRIPEGAWVGNPNDPRMEEHRRRYQRLDRENAQRNGSQEQYQALLEQQRRENARLRDQRRDNRQEWRDDRREARRDRRDDRQDWRQDRREDRRDWRQDRRDDRRDWNRSWRSDRRYDWQRYRNSNRFVFRIDPYYAPYRGYRYNRYGIGSILDRGLWGRNYWISDPYRYRLPPAPIGYQWVRYYNDVVLVDTWSGRIVDVIHDFFW